MLRAALFILFAFFYVILSPFIWLAAWIAHFFNMHTRDMINLRGVQGILRIAAFCCGMKTECEGLENIPEDQAVLFVMNHRSIFDIVALYPLFKRPVGFIGKIELKKIPVLSTWLTVNHGLFMDRSNIREGLKTILAGVENLKNGYSMVIFPEGTRCRDEDLTSLLPFHGGSFKLAEKANVPVVPVVIYNTAACFEDHVPALKATRIKMRFLPPVDVASMSPADRKQLSSIVFEKMQSALKAIEGK